MLSGMEQRTYNIREAALEVGRSVSWLRSQVRRGRLSPDRVRGKYGEEYVFTDADLMAARSLVPVKRTREGAVAEAYSLASRAENVNLSLRERVADLNAEVARLRAEQEGVAQMLRNSEEERERIRTERDAERERLERAQEEIRALLSRSWWDVLRGKR